MEDNERKSYNEEDQDDFGLPEVEYSPLDREDEIPPVYEQPHYYRGEEEENSKSKGLIIFGILSVVLIAGLCIYLFLFGGMEQVSKWLADEPAPPVYVEPEPEPIPEVVEEVTPEPEINPLAPYSDVTTISEPTGRSYIVIGSFVDEDLALDFSNKMIEQGIGVKILAPTGRAPLMHRVAVADFADFSEAMSDLELFRNNYGENTWVLKY
ncbi:SPOR domain-containing protein [Catalinimonas niigatensis]|uniref:SPOR domain-containing protein n=1 Tax=Catalinimonas niigatensis TaxID=1397264 RepID=UPI002666F26F|nr:SPOR domain-containing protein [Catalinimonas niigatensis]WPP50892.1 SPOR domain-containing protein [Catalinimonas niigatensis]